MIFLIVVCIIFRNEINGGIGTVYEGHCDTVSKYATLSHVLINVLGAMLLSASNYTMQVVCAPTRSDIDRAHERGDWLDIGVPSFRNIMGRISKQHIIVWWVSAECNPFRTKGFGAELG